MKDLCSKIVNAMIPGWSIARHETLKQDPETKKMKLNCDNPFHSEAKSTKHDLKHGEKFLTKLKGPPFGRKTVIDSNQFFFWRIVSVSNDR